MRLCRYASTELVDGLLDNTGYAPGSTGGSEVTVSAGAGDRHVDLWEERRLT